MSLRESSVFHHVYLQTVTKYSKHIHSECSFPNWKSVNLPLFHFSSNHAVATVSLGFGTPDDRRAHTAATLLVPTTHQWQLTNPRAGSNSPHSVKHKTWRPFTVKHQNLLEKGGSARHMFSKWQGLLITQRNTSEAMWSRTSDGLKCVCCGSERRKWEKLSDYSSSQNSNPDQ